MYIIYICTYINNRGRERNKIIYNDINRQNLLLFRKTIRNIINELPLRRN